MFPLNPFRRKAEVPEEPPATALPPSEPTIEELEDRYRVLKHTAKEERRKLEELRKQFSAQCQATESAEAKVSTLRATITERLLKDRGLEP